MKTTAGDSFVTSAKDIACVLRGALVMLAVLGAFILVLAMPVYLAASYIGEWGGPSWLAISASAALAGAELYGLGLFATYLENLEDREP